MANRPFKIPKDTKGNEYFPVTTTDAIIYSDNGEKKVLTEVIKKDLEDLSSLIIDEESRVLKENERKAAEISRTTEEDIRKQNEEDRKANELTRQNSFSSNEAVRQKTFNDNESARQNTFIKAESQRETAETIRQEEELKRQEAETIRQKNYDKKVDRTDNAPELTAGFAGNLVGRGEATSEEIGFRPSGGLTSVNDGAARIERLKGNTVVWNQTYPTGWTGYSQGVTTESTNGLITVNGTLTGSYFSIKNGVGYSDIPTNHMGLYVCQVVKDDANYMEGKHFSLHNVQGLTREINNKYAYLFYTNLGTDGWGLGFKLVNTGDVLTDIQIRVSIYDLTQMFGAGNEPTTIEEFNARKPLGIDEYAYNEGELISTTADEIKSVGFNAWDEEWEVGSIYPATGIDQESTSTIRSKNYNRMLPNTKYCLYSKSGKKMAVILYDEDKKFIDYWINSNLRGITTTSDTRFFRVMTYNGYGPTYNNDICIHLVHTGYRNGEYEPYEEFRRTLPISEIKDSEGNALFPNGLLSAGSVYDEITEKKAIKRIGVVDMGTLNWWSQYTQYNYGYVASAPNSMKTENLNYAVSIGYEKYANPSVEAWKALDKAISNGVRPIGPAWTGYLAVKDSSHGDLPSFKAAMSGVMLYYELAEPIEVDLPEPINMDYEVSDFGTEEVISDTPTTPLKADIIYQFNAVDRIRENSLSIGRLEQQGKELNGKVAELEQEVIQRIDNEIQDLNEGLDDIIDVEIGPNLCDNSLNVQGVVQSNGTISVSGAWGNYKTSPYIEIAQNTDYVFTSFYSEIYDAVTSRKLVALFDASKNVITDTWQNVDYVNKLVFNSGNAKYARISAQDNLLQLREGTEITKYAEYSTKAVINKELGAIPLAQVRLYDVLFGKKWAVVGDSFSAWSDETFANGVFMGEKKTYKYFIAERTGIEILDYTLSGRTMAYPSDHTFDNAFAKPSIYQSIPSDVDYITIMLGINDASHLGGSSQDGEPTQGSITLGTIDSQDTGTFYGAWNVVLKYLFENYPNAHIGVIVTNGLSSNGPNSYAWSEGQQIYDAELAIVQKWNLPYIDLNGGDGKTPMMQRGIYPTGTPLDLINAKWNAFATSPTSPYNGHTNAAGHKYESTFIENFLRSL